MDVVRSKRPLPIIYYRARIAKKEGILYICVNGAIAHLIEQSM